MIYALDTMVVSEPRKQRPHGAVLKWFANTPISDYAIPTMVFYELQQGVEATRKQDPQKASELDLWITTLMARSHVLPFSADVARETARLMQGHSPHLFEDASIAATGRVYGLTIATRNTHDFERFQVPLVNPFLST